MEAEQLRTEGTPPYLPLVVLIGLFPYVAYPGVRCRSGSVVV